MPPGSGTLMAALMAVLSPENPSSLEPSESLVPIVTSDSYRRTAMRVVVAVGENLSTTSTANF